MSLSIIPFAPEYTCHFRDLNLAWLERYFCAEPKDMELLNSAQSEIIDKGGYIFMAKYHDEIIGCFSYIKRKEHIYELGKMAVAPKYQGVKIGQRLLSFAIDFAKRNNWKKVVLYSSTKLGSALHIYRKYGFKHIALEKNLPYARSDVKMELILRP